MMIKPQLTPSLVVKYTGEMGRAPELTVQLFDTNSLCSPLPSPSELSGHGNCFTDALHELICQLDEYVAALTDYKTQVLLTQRAYQEAILLPQKEGEKIMTYREQIHAALRKRVAQLPDSPAKQSFQEDLERLCQLDSNQSLPGITASAWIDKLDNLSDDLLKDYVQKYKKNLLNPWTEGR